MVCMACIPRNKRNDSRGGGVEIKLANFPDDKSHLTVFNETNLFIQTIGKGVDFERSFADTKK